jgi:MYXO-CTERM domain-containing protein
MAIEGKRIAGQHSGTVSVGKLRRSAACSARLAPRNMAAMRGASYAGIVALLSLSACGSSAPSLDGPTGEMIAAAARAEGVPADLMVAIAHVEGGLKLAPIREVHADEAIPVAGVLELRHGRFDSLARGAELSGEPERELVRDLAKGTRAGARVLSDLATRFGIQRADVAAWAPVLEELSGHLHERERRSYRARVLAVLRDGGEIHARGGEILSLHARDDVPLTLTIEPPAIATQGTPEFSGAIWFDTPQAGKWTPGREGEAVTMIAIHDTEGGWDASVATLQNDPGKSVHYIIDADGSRVGQFISEADTGWHVGNWHYNLRMVGIEHVGFASKDDYQTALYETSAELVRDIAKRHDLGPNGDGTALDRSVLVGHQEVPDGGQIPQDSPPCPDSPGTCVQSPNYGGASNHRDPGIYWEWCQYLEIIGEGARCKCNDAFTHFNCTHDMTERVKCSDGENVIIDHCANASCTVQPIGVDDTCAEYPPVSSSSSSSSGGVGGAGGDGGAGGADGGAGGEAGHESAARVHEASGCAASGDGGVGGDDAKSMLVALSALALVAARRRRPR